MSANLQIDILPLQYRDAPKLAPLIAAYTQALKRGAPRQPDMFYAESLLQDRSAEFFGAFLDEKLVGFVMFYDLPDPISGKRAGQVDHIYVHHEHMGNGIAQAMLDVLADQGENRGWRKLTLNSPHSSEVARHLFQSVATPANQISFEVIF
ncbi:MAG: GNAT family N-acetyltransferase [Rhizobiaceae bacterium]|nr:GNAT family N-acetyltransferase [Rhizobiaceae bacterium]